MSNYYGINRSDEYLQHWGIPKGGQRKNHKYLMRVKSGSGWRYLYTPAEVAAYGKERVSGALSKAGRMAKSLGGRIGKQATYGVQRVTSLLFKDASTNSRGQKGSLRGSDATDVVQARLKKAHRGSSVSIRSNGGGTNSKDAAAQPFKKSFGRFEPRGDKDKTSTSTGIVGKAAGKVKSKVLKAAGAKNSKASAFKAADKRVANLGKRSEYDSDERLYSGFKRIQGGKSTTPASQKATSNRSGYSSRSPVAETTWAGPKASPKLVDERTGTKDKKKYYKGWYVKPGRK